MTREPLESFCSVACFYINPFNLVLLIQHVYFIVISFYALHFYIIATTPYSSMCVSSFGKQHAFHCLLLEENDMLGCSHTTACLNVALVK